MGDFSLSGGVEIIGFISPTDTTDTYPVIDTLYGIDGLRNVNNLTQLNAIPNQRRRSGMLVGVSGGTEYYKLNSPPWSGTTDDWSIFTTDGGTFTGNTSGDCIVDLYITNLYGCSPITVHDNIQHISSSATGINSIAWGTGTTASGDYSHAEGSFTQATGTTSHAEGSGTTASGLYSHAEGVGTTAFHLSHAEGGGTVASGFLCHTEGAETIANGIYGHAEGYRTQAGVPGEIWPHFLFASHAEGYLTLASGYYSHAEGKDTTASGDGSHAEGGNTIASGDYSHAEGTFTTASGYASHAEGYSTEAGNGVSAHAEGGNTIASGDYSHAGGKGYTDRNLVASGDTTFIHFKQTKPFCTFNGLTGSTCGGVTGFTYSGIGAFGDYSAILGGTDHNIGSGAESSAIFAGSGNTIQTGVTNSVILGGSVITATTSDTVYVPNLNLCEFGGTLYTSSISGCSPITIGEANFPQGITVNDLPLLSQTQVKVSLTTAQLKTAYSVPIDAGIAAPGAGKAIIVTSLAVDYTVGVDGEGEPDPFNFTKGNIRLQISGATSGGSGTQYATDDPGGGTGILNTTAFLPNMFIQGNQNLGASTPSIFPNRILHITTDSDATSGSGSAIVYITYYLLNI
jgi:hypothetical protein